MDGHSPHPQISPTAVKEEKNYPSLMSRPSSSDACATIVQGLMMFNQSPDEEFSRKACESLVKKMKDKRDELDALIVSVYSQGEDAKKCITIARTLDGRLQVAGRKGFPHVVYAKIFRWPDLHKNELKHLPICENAFDLKADNVCVNPFHYERVVNAGMGNIEVKVDDEDGQEQNESRPAAKFFPINQMKPANQQITPMQQLPPLQMSGIGAHQQPQSKMLSPTGQASGNRFVNFNSQMVPPHISGILTNQNQPAHGQTAHGPRSQIMDINSPSHNQPRVPPPRMQTSPQQGGPSGQQSSSQQQFQGQQALGPMGPGEPGQYAPPARKPMSAINVPNQNNIERPAGAPPLETFENAPAFDRDHPLCENPKNYQSIENVGFSRRNILCVNNGEPVDAPMDDQQNWVTMVYYEKQNAICSYTATKSTIYVDCGYASASNRWCLGGLFRDGILSVDKDEALRKIGRGIRMSCKENGDVWIQNFSHNPIFFQSNYLDREAGRGAGDVVHKIYPGSRVKMYDAEKGKLIMKDQWMSTLMNRCRLVTQGVAEDDILLGDSLIDEYGNRRELPLAQHVKDDPLTELFRFCLARIAFIEGWGPDYEARNSIDDCNCWIEIKLNHAFAFLDHLLTETQENPVFRRNMAQYMPRSS